MSKYADWKDRQAGFGQFADSVKSEIEKSTIAEATDLVALTDSLHKFTTELFCFFLNGFRDFLGFDETQDKIEFQNGRASTIKLIPSAEYPPEYVLQRILQQASFDLTVIQRLGEQRRSEKLRPCLEQFDQLALLALSIAFPDPKDRNTWLIEPAKPFVYLQRDTTVRITPYANAMLIGVPVSALEQAIDLLSIPHEIGHYIYQTGRFSKLEPINLFFEKYFADRPGWIRNWLEEIFADLYGSLVAGPIVAFSLQEILLDNLPETLAEDDGDHPAGIIRPLTFSALFKSNRFNGGSGAEKTAIRLEERWQNERRRRGFANAFTPSTESETIDGVEAGNILSLVLRDMNEKINSKTKDAFDFPAQLDAKRNLQPWRLFPSEENPESAADQIDLDKPFDNFEVGKILSDRQAQVNKMKKLLDPKVSKFKLSREAQNAYWLNNQLAYWEEQNRLIQENDDKDLLALPPDIWKLLFTAFSWAVRGPDDTRPVTGPENIRY